MDHKTLIDQAQAEEETVVVDSDGEELGRWIPVATNRADSFDYPEIACRSRQVAGKDVLEILVASDPFNVNGSHLKRVLPSVDSQGVPCVNFTLDSKGARLFGGLTGNNLPDKVSDFTRKMGIILNDELHSAPAIRSTIFDRGEITGSFTQDEVEDLCAILNAGSLPAPIRLVDQPDSTTSGGGPASQ